MFKNYIKLTFKILLRRKIFTAVSLFGISCTLTVLLVLAALFSYVLISNPVEKNLSNNLYFNHIEIEREYGGQSASIGAYAIEKVVRPLETIKRISVHSLCYQPVIEYLKNGSIEIRFRETDENYWNFFSFTFIEGTAYNLQHIESGSRVAVISERVRNRYFGKGKVVGKTFVLNNVSYKVIGVVQNVSQILHTAFADVYIPYDRNDYLKELNAKSIISKYSVIIQKQKGVSSDAVRNEFEKRLQQMERPDYYLSVKASLRNPFQSLYYDYYWINDDFYIKIGITLIAFFVFLPLLNITNLNTSSVLERYEEIGLRRSFGAKRHHILIQFITENLVVTLLGGAVAFAAAWGILSLINSFELLGYSNFSPNLWIFMIGLGVILIFGTLAGLYPAIHLARLEINNAMKGGAK